MYWRFTTVLRKFDIEDSSVMTTKSCHAKAPHVVADPQIHSPTSGCAGFLKQKGINCPFLAC